MKRGWIAGLAVLALLVACEPVTPEPDVPVGSTTRFAKFIVAVHNNQLELLHSRITVHMEIVGPDALAPQFKDRMPFTREYTSPVSYEVSTDIKHPVTFKLRATLISTNLDILECYVSTIAIEDPVILVPVKPVQVPRGGGSATVECAYAL